MKNLSTIVGVVALATLMACGGESDPGMDEMGDDMAPSSEMVADSMAADSMATDSMEQGMPEEMVDEDMTAEPSGGVDDGMDGEMGGGA